MGSQTHQATKTHDQVIDNNGAHAGQCISLVFRDGQTCLSVVLLGLAALFQHLEIEQIEHHPLLSIEEENISRDIEDVIG